MKRMNNIDLMDYWVKSSDEDFVTMEILYKNNQNTWCLYIGQLVIEKLLKALYAKKNKNAPYAPKSHDLLYLAEKIEIELNDRQKTLLDIITRFNIEARYDDYKESFRRNCTQEYTKEQIKNIKEVREWLKNLLMVE